MANAVAARCLQSRCPHPQNGFLKLLLTRRFSLGKLLELHDCACSKAGMQLKEVVGAGAAVLVTAKQHQHEW